MRWKGGKKPANNRMIQIHWTLCRGSGSGCASLGLCCTSNFFYWPGGLSLYITAMLVQRVITGRYSVENEIWMIPVPSGSARNDRARHSQAGAQMSQRGVRVWEDRRGGTGWSWTPPQISHQQPQKCRRWQNQFRANRIRSKYLMHLRCSMYNKDSHNVQTLTLRKNM